MRIEPVLTESSCLVLRDHPDRAAVLAALARAAAGVLERADHVDILAGLEARERDVPTSTPEGVAFPHTSLPGLSRLAIVIAALHPAVFFHPGDRAPTRLAVCLVSARERPFEHVGLLARVARMMASPEARNRFAGAPNALSLRALLIREDRSHE